MPCKVCSGPICVDPESGESYCGLDPSHDVDGSELVDDEFPRDDPSDAEESFDPDDPMSYPPEKPWTITSDALADWALAKVKRARWEIDRINERADDEVNRVNEWRADACRGAVRDVEFFEGHLIAYRKSVTPAKGKTYRLFHGELKAAEGSKSCEVENDVFADWAEANERLDLIEYKPQPKKAAIRAALEAGEVIPGARLVVGEERFFVVTGKGEPPAVLPMPNEAA